MTSNGTSRRHILIAGGAATVGTLAGCLDDDTIEEMEAAGDQAGQHIDDAEASLDAAFERHDAEDYEGCVEETTGIEDDIAAAREEAQTALELAEEVGDDNAIEVFELMLAFIDKMDEVATELELLCEASIEENWEEADQRAETVDDLSADLDQIGRDLDQATAESE